MKLSIKAGSTSQSVTILIQDSSSTTGAGLTGLTNASGGLVAYYTFSGTSTTATSITLASLVAVNSAYSSGGFKEISAANMPGIYRLDIPNAALAGSSGRSSVIILHGATNMAPCVLEIELTGWDNQDAVHGGFSCLPNTAVTTNGSLITSGTGTAQLSVSSGNVTLTSGGLANVTTWTVAITGNITGNLSGSVGSVTGAVGSVTGNVSGNVTGSVGTVNALATGAVTDITDGWQALTLANSKTYAEAMEFLVSIIGAGETTGAEETGAYTWVITDTNGGALASIHTDGIGNRDVITW